MNNERGQIILTAEEWNAAVRVAGGAHAAIAGRRNTKAGGRGVTLADIGLDEASVESLSRQQRKPRDERERRLQSSIVKLARLYGWSCYHVYDSGRTVPGFPDLELARAEPARIIKVELKDETNKPTEDQVEWLNLYAAMGGLVEVYLWRPQHLDAIAEILKPEWKLNDADPRVFGLWALGQEPVAVRKLPTKARTRARPASRKLSG